MQNNILHPTLSRRQNKMCSVSSYIAAGRWLAKDHFQQRGAATKVWNGDIRANTEQALAFPFVHLAGTVIRFVAGDGDGQSADFFRVLNFHIAVSEREQLFTGNCVLPQDAVDHHFFGELLEIVQRAVDVFAEIAGDVQQLRLLPNIRLVRAAGEVEGNFAALQVFQHRAGAEHQEIVGLQRAPAQAFDALSDPLVQAPQVLILIPERFARLTAALPDGLRGLNNLINRLFAVLPHDVVTHQLPSLVVRFSVATRQHFQEHRDHDFRPTLANQGKRTVEIKQNMADAGARCEAGTEFDQLFERGNGRHLPVSYLAFAQKSIVRQVWQRPGLM